MRADTITKDYVKDAGVFADIFNYYIYGGRQVILPEQLTERDSTKIAQIGRESCRERVSSPV